MQIETHVLGMVSTNCHIISNQQTKQAILVDPGYQSENLAQHLNNQGLQPVAILLTHGHFDHIMAAKQLALQYEIPVYAAQEERTLLRNSQYNLSYMVNEDYTMDIDQPLVDGDLLILAGMHIAVIHTPGHTQGGVCYYLAEEGVLFSGDTLFLNSVGRTDMPFGNAQQLKQSINEKLLVLPDETIVYPGHGGTTTIAHEKMYNPFVR